MDEKKKKKHKRNRRYKKYNPNTISTEKDTVAEKEVTSAIFNNRYQQNIHYFVCNSALTGRHPGSMMNRRTRTICTL